MESSKAKRARIGKRKLELSSRDSKAGDETVS